uniref:Uncharacterized protein n=2 Tax=Alexandrium monilatum TaxID=311494 RepID=A0A7S4UZ25_9DINO
MCRHDEPGRRSGRTRAQVEARLFLAPPPPEARWIGTSSQKPSLKSASFFFEELPGAHCGVQRRGPVPPCRPAAQREGVQRRAAASPSWACATEVVGRGGGSSGSTSPPLGTKVSSDAHVARYGGRLLGGQDGTLEQRRGQLIQCATLLDGVLEGGLQLPVFYLLKDGLHLGPVDLSLTMGLLVVPWALKPGLALLSDRVPVFGRRRTPHLAAGAVLVAGACLGASLATSYVGTVGMLSLNTLGRCFLSAALQGIVVEVARPQGERGCARATGDFFLLKTSGALGSALASSLLVAVSGPRSALQGLAVLPLCLLTAAARYEAVAEPEGLAAKADIGVSALPELRNAARDPAIWAPLALMVAYNAGPNYDDSLYYYYIDKLHFRPQMLGQLKIAQELAKLLGIGLYRGVLYNVSDKALLLGLASVSFPLYLTPLMLTTGAYRRLHLDPRFLAVSGEFVREVFLHVQTLPVFSRWVRQCPEGLEGTVIALLVSVVHASRFLSKVSSAATASALGIGTRGYGNMSLLVVVCAVSCLLPLPLAAALPSGTALPGSGEEVPPSDCQACEVGGPSVQLGSERRPSEVCMGAGDDTTVVPAG